MMIFSYRFGDNDPLIEMTLSPESTLPEVIEAFESFLRCAGYVFDGELDLIEKDTTNDA